MTIKSLKLYHYPLTRSARVKWMLHETVGDRFETQIVSVIRGAMMTPSMLAMNPNHNLPMLDITWEDGSEQTMLESAAMVMFLADAYPDKQLAPPPEMTRERADYLQMIQFGGTWMDMMLWQIRLHNDLLPEDMRHAGTVDRYKSKWQGEVEPQLTARLAQHDYICGDVFTAADCLIAANIRWSQAYGLSRDKTLIAYLRRMAERPAYEAAYADADQFGKI